MLCILTKSESIDGPVVVDDDVDMNIENDWNRVWLLSLAQSSWVL